MVWYYDHSIIWVTECLWMQHGSPVTEEGYKLPSSYAGRRVENERPAEMAAVDEEHNYREPNTSGWCLGSSDSLAEAAVRC